AAVRLPPAEPDFEGPPAFAARDLRDDVEGGRGLADRTRARAHGAGRDECGPARLRRAGPLDALAVLFVRLRRGGLGRAADPDRFRRQPLLLPDRPAARRKRRGAGGAAAAADDRAVGGAARRGASGAGDGG